MPEFDLDKDRYRVRTRRGNWIVRDKPWQFVYAVLVFAGLLGFMWWHRAELTLISMLGLTAVVSFGAGVLVAVWLKRFD